MENDTQLVILYGRLTIDLLILGEENMSLIVLKQVTKDYQMGEMSVRALRDIEQDIDEQSFVSFVGPSGSKQFKRKVEIWTLFYF